MNVSRVNPRIGLLPWSAGTGARGFSGAGIGNLTALEPYRPVFIGGALVALFLAYRQIYRPVAACEVGSAPQARSAYKMIFWGVAALVGVAVAFPYILPLFN